MLNSPDGRFNEAFTLYAMHTQAIEDFIDKLVHADNPNDQWEQYRLANAAGINVNRLSASEISYIEEEVSKRL